MIDSDNFLWYKSTEGLIKEAGNHRIFYPFNFPTSRTRFVDNYLQLLEFEEQEIFGITRRGIFRLKKNDDAIEWLYFSDQQDLIRISNFKMDGRGNLWVILNQQKIAKYSVEAGLEVIPLENEIAKILPSGYIIHHVTNDNHLILKSLLSNEMYYYDYKTTEKLNFPSNEKTFPSVIKNGHLFPKDSSGIFYLGNEKLQFQYLKEYDVQIYQFPHYLHRVQIDATKRNLYLFKEKDIFIYSADIGSLHFKKHQYSNNYLVSYIYPEKNGNLYFSDANGLGVLKQENRKIHPQKFYRDGVLQSNVSVRSINTANDGKLYANTYSGWYLYNQDKDRFEEIQFRDERTGEPLFSVFYGFYKVDEYTLIAYGANVNLFVIDLKSNTYKNIFPDRTMLSDIGPTLDITRVDSETLLIGGFYGLLTYNHKIHTFSNNHPILKGLDSLDTAVEKLYLDYEQNELWIGLKQEGLIKKNLNNEKMIRFSENDPRYPLVNNQVTVIQPSLDQQDLWIGTYNGFQKIHRSTLKSQMYTSKQGPSGSVTGMIPNGKDLWIATYEGLIRFNMETEQSYTYYEEDGLDDNEFNKKSFFKVSNDSLLFGGVKGLVSFNPNLLNDERKKRRIFLVESEYYDQKIEQEIQLKKDLDQVTKFQIPFDFNYLTLRVAVNNPENNDGAQYQYRFKGIKDDWINAGSLGEINLQGLSVGKYNLEIRAVDEYGVTSNTLQYDLKVSKVFYKRTWFLIVTIFILMLAIALYLNSRRRSLQQEMKYHLSRTDALRSQMNPHVIFNALNGIQSTILLEGEKAANEYIVTYGNYIRNSLDMNRNDLVSLDANIKYLESFLNFEKVRLNGNLEYRIEMEDGLDLKTTFIPGMFVQPLIENAILHGLSPKPQDRLLKVRYSKDEDQLVVEVIDNGIGRKASAERNKEKKIQRESHGTAIMKERIKHLNSIYKGKLSLEIFDLMNADEPAGTKAVVKMPFIIKKDLTAHKKYSIQNN